MYINALFLNNLKYMIIHTILMHYSALFLHTSFVWITDNVLMH